MFRGGDLQRNVCAGVVIRALSRIHLRDYFWRRAGVKTVEASGPDWSILWACLRHYLICFIYFVICALNYTKMWLLLIHCELHIVCWPVLEIYVYFAVLMLFNLLICTVLYLVCHVIMLALFWKIYIYIVWKVAFYLIFVNICRKIIWLFLSQVKLSRCKLIIINNKLYKFTLQNIQYTNIRNTKM